MQANAPSNCWRSVASSADGRKLVAVAGTVYNLPGFFNATNAIYTSTNSGITWMQTSAPSNDWVAVASSADGKRLVAVDQLPNSIWTSPDSGITWISNSVPHDGWYSVASSADGIRLLAGGEHIYISINSGMDWSSDNAPAKTTWLSVASSADGNKLVGGLFAGGIYISQATPSPELNISAINKNHSLSWLIPSTNFVLQQSFNLAFWSDVTNIPVLNLTNLQNEVALPLSDSGGFYRLKAP